MTGNPTNCTGNSKSGVCSWARTDLSLNSIMVNISADNNANDGNITRTCILSENFSQILFYGHENVADFFHCRIKNKIENKSNFYTLNRKLDFKIDDWKGKRESVVVKMKMMMMYKLGTNKFCIFIDWHASDWKKKSLWSENGV